MVGQIALSFPVSAGVVFEIDHERLLQDLRFPALHTGPCAVDQEAVHHQQRLCPTFKVGWAQVVGIALGCSFPGPWKDHPLLSDENLALRSPSKVMTPGFYVYYRQIYSAVSFMLVGECQKTSRTQEKNRDIPHILITRVIERPVPMDWINPKTA